MNNTKLLLIFLVIILLGFFYNELWISFIIGAVLLLTMFVQPEPSSAPKPKTGPIIRPIRVQRKYVGAESIYPEKMEIKIHGRPGKREEYGPEAVGKAVGSSLRWVKNLFKDD